MENVFLNVKAAFVDIKYKNERNVDGSVTLKTTYFGPLEINAVINTAKKN